ncbi:MAG: sugar kinase [Verrucomicrobia bacterium]|nr:sugar kinase [Verrucomicrobiota bacterium]
MRAEANVAVSYSYFGGKSCFITALPDHEIGHAAARAVRQYGVDTSFIQFIDHGRLGLYFVETGANQRPGRVIYDRDHSTIFLLAADQYPFAEAFADAQALHVTGITPALSESAAAATLKAVKIARDKGMQVSCDLNFRAKLWRWRPGTAPKALARETMHRILPMVDLLIANESDAEDVLGLSAGTSQTADGKVDHAGYTSVAQAICERYPNIRRVAFTLRESISATHNNWSAMLYDAHSGNTFFAPWDQDGLNPYEIRQIVDRVGAGDSFGAGLLYAMYIAFPHDLAKAIGFATAASCLAHSVCGDFNLNTFAEVEQLRQGNASGRVQR